MLAKDREILRLRRIIEEQNRLIKAPTLNIRKLDPESSLSEKITLVKLINKRVDQDLRPYLMNIWKLKFLLKRALKLQCSNLS